jgi:hypothetical protein
MFFRWMLQFGAYDLTNAHYEEWTPRKIAYYYIHPLYNNFSAYYDIAVLQLNEALQFREHVIPVCLPQQNDTRTTSGYYLRVTGWGEIENRGSTSLLRSTTLQLRESR